MSLPERAVDVDFNGMACAGARVARESHRPLARDPVKFAALYRARREIYQLADVHVPIDCDDPEEAVEAILAHSLFR